MKSRHCCTINNLYNQSHGIPTSQLILLLFFLLLTPVLHVVEAQQPSDPASSDDDDALQGSKVSPSMAMIVIVLVLGFFITGCISIYIQQCTDHSSVGDAAVIARNGNLMRATQRGLDQSVIDTFPTFLYSDVKELKFGKGALECAVCLNEFEKDETLRLLPKCDHVFHPECIDAWLMAHTTCPVCRANLVPEPSELTSKEESHHSHTDMAESGTSYEVEVTVEPLPPKGTRVPRSHSTGHSLVGPSEDRERFTLRLPDEVRKQLMVAQPKLSRSASLVALPRVSSSRRGYRSNGGEGSGSSRYGRFFGRSFRWTTRNNGVDGDVGVGSKRFFGSVVTPVEALPRLPV